jgi:hypothetical protein
VVECLVAKTYEFELVVGGMNYDYGTSPFSRTIKSNLPKTKLLKAYKAGIKACGIDKKMLSEDALFLREDLAESLAERGLTFAGCGSRYLDKEEYLNLWLFIAKIGNPELEFELRQRPEQELRIGGIFFR